ncbi:MAG: MBL fold metallo-hydrolase [Anaerolineae bacterium]|nr:MBL fold metallo-hydrolase [Anaerolineae bacterium]
MRVKFWGARGGIPVPMSEVQLREKMREALFNAVGVDLTDWDAIDRYLERLPRRISSTAGGNTTCIEVRGDDFLFILDCGSGIRLLGKELLKGPFGSGQGEAHILVTHTHWDHIQGFPFFDPAFVAGNRLHFHSPFPDLRARFEDQQREVYFPVTMDFMHAERTWEILDPAETVTIAGVRVSMILLSHPGGAYAYRLEHGGKSVILATDGEYHRMDAESTARYVEFFKGADLLIFDAQYSFEQAIDEKRDWGHSTPKMGAELAFRAGVKRLALTHHDQMASDDRLWDSLPEAYNHLAFRGRASGSAVETEVLLAEEGLEIEV